MARQMNSRFFHYFRQIVTINLR
jgi:hypothetical protein